MCRVSSLSCWLLGRASSHSGLPSFTGGLICKGVELLGRQKFEVSTPSSCTVSSGKKVSGCWCSLPGMMLSSQWRFLQAVLTPEDFWDLEAASVTLFFTKIFIFQDLGLEKTLFSSWMAVNDLWLLLSLSNSCFKSLIIFHSFHHVSIFNKICCCLLSYLCAYGINNRTR